MRSELESYPISTLHEGMKVEFEHGSASPNTDVTHDDPMSTMKIALAHLRERPDYYVRLEKYVEKMPRKKGTATTTTTTTGRRRSPTARRVPDAPRSRKRSRCRGASCGTVRWDHK